jgi:hypothetical protein
MNNQNSLSYSELIHILSNPNSKDATAIKFQLKDSKGNQMQCVSVIELFNSPEKYAAVYHTPYPVDNAYRFKINLAVSDDLINWTYKGLLVDNADMPEIRKAENGEWIVVIHEQWLGNTNPSTGPCALGFKLFYSEADLLNCTINDKWTAPQLLESNYNGTPNFYKCVMKQDDKGWWYINAEFGFHYFDAAMGRDLNGYGYTNYLFNPNPENPVEIHAKKATPYNNLLMANEVTGNIGQRCNIRLLEGNFNIQEGNVGQPQSDFGKWRIFIYQFMNDSEFPTGNGDFIEIHPQTPGGSISFGNPRISIVSTPGKNTQSLVVSYFIFQEGVPPNVNEGGGLLYYTEI